ncbi:hypothetical protein [Shewanella colwelliana]|uniref:hypothetical protein n=1 Tax=Shewanella colwelliana TaxID=23 RepID=UPI0037368078
MKAKLMMASVVVLSMLGCSSAPEGPASSEQYIGVGNVDYDSLYHFGYNTGCRSAGMVKQDSNLGSVEAMKDKVLDGLDEFDKGWAAGTKACEDGVSRSMYTVK